MNSSLEGAIKFFEKKTRVYPKQVYYAMALEALKAVASKNENNDPILSSAYDKLIKLWERRDNT